MKKTYKFFPPYTNATHTKRFSSDDKALQYAASGDDTAASTGVSKRQEGFWNEKYNCFMPLECLNAVNKVETELNEEIARLQDMFVNHH